LEIDTAKCQPAAVCGTILAELHRRARLVREATG
jgi:hypothetical protein